MCRHTREPTVLPRVSCRPSHLNIDRFHQLCLLLGRTSRVGEDCRPRTTWRPLSLLEQPGSSYFASHWRFFATPTGRHHGRMLIHRIRKGVCTHAGSGPSRVRRRLLTACIGDPISLATVVRLHDFVKESISAEFKSFLLIMCIDAPKSTTKFSFLWFQS